MAEYIDRANLIARIKYYVTHTPEGSGEHYAYSVVLNEILNHPAADVVPVVRCKDCKYQDDCWNCYHPRHHGILLTTYPLDFCSYGERKGGGEDND